MENEHPIAQALYEAREDPQKADDFIRAYLPFIRSEASKFMGRFATDQDEEYAVAMAAFYEAMIGYEKLRGPFLGYAALCIRSRLTDFRRREARQIGHISLDAQAGDGDFRTLADTLPDPRDHYDEAAQRQATRQEIRELSGVMAAFGVSLSDAAEHCPKQERTLDACRAAVCYAGEHPLVLEELLRTRKLPIGALAKGTGVPRKTLERHRKYLIAMCLIQTNGYEIIRGHLCRLLKKGGVLK